MLTPDQHCKPRRFVVSAGKEADYHHRRHYDGESEALPGGDGISHHQSLGRHRAVSHRVQFTRVIHSSEADNRSLREKFIESVLRDFRDVARSSTGAPSRNVRLAETRLASAFTRFNARGVGGRTEAMDIRTSQYNPGSQIPEKNWLYRLAKRFWFNDFGAYRGYDHSATAAPGLVNRQAARGLAFTATPQTTQTS